MRKRALPQGIAGVGLSVFLVASLVGISASNSRAKPSESTTTTLAGS